MHTLACSAHARIACSLVQPYALNERGSIRAAQGLSGCAILLQILQTPQLGAATRTPNNPKTQMLRWPCALLIPVQHPHLRPPPQHAHVVRPNTHRHIGLGRKPVKECREKSHENRAARNDRSRQRGAGREAGGRSNGCADPEMRTQQLCEGALALQGRHTRACTWIKAPPAQHDNHPQAPARASNRRADSAHARARVRGSEAAAARTTGCSFAAASC